MARKTVARKSVARKSVSRKSSAGTRKSMTRKSIKRTATGVGTKAKKPSTSKDRHKSPKKAPHQFEEVEITIPELGPFFVLLKCKEPALIIRAIDTIYDYIKRVTEVVPYVLSKNTINLLKVYSQGDLLFIPLRAMKLIAELSQYTDSHDDIISDDTFIRFLVKSYGENIDPKWKEVSSKILTEITQNLNFCRIFIQEYADLSHFVTMLKIPDPDVIYNSLMLIKNLVRDKYLAEKFVNTQEFMFDKLFPCFESLYIEIQRLALQLVHWFVYQPETEDLKKLFIDEGGIDKIYNILLNLIKNLVRDKQMAEKFVNVQEFMFDKFFPCFESLYIEIQRLALQLVHWFVYQPETEDLKKLFIDEGGIDKIYNILLNKYAWRDLHPLALDILQAAYNNEERVASLKEDGIKKLVGYLEFIEDDDLIVKAMNVIVQWSARIYGRWMLLRLGMLQRCCNYLLDGTIPMKIVACQFINEIALEREKLRRLVQHVNVPALVNLIINVNHPNDLVSMAHTLFNNLIKFSRFDIAVHCTKSPLKEELSAWMKDNYDKVPPLNKRLILNTISILAQNNMVRPHFIDFSIIDLLCKSLQDRNEELYDVTIVAAEALQHLIKTEPNACQYLFLNGGLEIMKHVFWTTKNTILREKLSTCFELAIENDQFMKLQLLRNDHLNWLVKNKIMWYESPSMKFVVEKFYDNYLPAKIAYTSRLGFEDKIEDGFYIFKENRPPSTLPFPYTMDDIEDLTVYIIGFEKNPIPEEIQHEIETEIIKKQVQNEQCIDLLKEFPEKSNCHPLGYSFIKDPKYIKKTEELTIHWDKDEDLNKYLETLHEKVIELDMNELLKLKEELNAPNVSVLKTQMEPFPPLKPGEAMRRYSLTTVKTALERAEAKLPEKLDLLSAMPAKVADVKKKPVAPVPVPDLDLGVSEPEKLKIPPKFPRTIDAHWVKERSRVIAEIVVNAMSGPEINEPCTYHGFNIYLSELKTMLNSNVVPLGLLKVGMKLERALLFKVLADKIDLPCTLVRGNKGQWWNELCIMELEDDCKGIADMPKRLMYPTHVIDLWMRPGHLMALGGRDANRYCGTQSNPQTYAREDWMAT